jgi:hypothetical protein
MKSGRGSRAPPTSVEMAGRWGQLVLRGKRLQPSHRRSVPSHSTPRSPEICQNGRRRCDLPPDGGSLPPLRSNNRYERLPLRSLFPPAGHAIPPGGRNAIKASIATASKQLLTALDTQLGATRFSVPSSTSLASTPGTSSARTTRSRPSTLSRRQRRRLALRVRFCAWASSSSTSRLRPSPPMRSLSTPC